MTPTDLSQRLAEALGESAVRTDPEHLALMARDIYRAGRLPQAVVRPNDVAALQQAVRLCAQACCAMVPRGGGASYTDGYLSNEGGHVLFDLAGLDRILVDISGRFVTVEAGVTWAALRERLAGLGLRTPFWGPFSGLVASVGGSISQNAISHGSAAHGISAQSVLGMEVVLANGELIETAASAATRFYGPDLTGLFTGDCGALGIKARIRLPLRAALPHHRALSFAFADFAAFHAGLLAATLEGHDDEHFALDLALSQGQIGKQEGLQARARMAAEVLRAAPGPWQGMRQLLRMAAAGERVLAAGAYMAHFIVEGATDREAAVRAERLQALLLPHGQPIANTVPGFVRAMPFAPLTNIFGPGGERWVPLHGVLPHGEVAAFHAACQALLASHQATMQALGVWTGTMFTSVGTTGLLYEMALYWRDAGTPLHEALVDAGARAALPQHAANPEAAAFVDTLKQSLIELLAAHGAAFFQIGRAYPYLSRLDPAAQALLRGIKATVDPQRLMNPGALGL